MTPEARAARDRLARYADPAIPFPLPGIPRGLAPLTAEEDNRLVAQLAEGIRDTLTPDLQTVLAALDEREAIADHDRCAAQRVREERERGRTRSEYGPDVRTPRDLDPPDGSVWGFPSDEHGLPHEGGE